MTAEPVLFRRGPLDRRFPLGSLSTVVLRGVSSRALVELKVATGRDRSTADTGALEPVLGLTLPAAGRVSARGDRLAVWLGPGWWLVDVPEDGTAAPAVLESVLVQRIRDIGGQVSAAEVSAGFCALELAGPQAAALLAHGCSIDLHPREFGAGRAARTMLAKAQVVLARIDDGVVGAPTFRIWVRTSFARYLVAWLLDASTEYVG